MMKTKGLLERLESGQGVVVAEGYLYECEIRGYLKAGHYTPEVILENPEVVQSLHREFVHAGSNAVLALTFYGHREKLHQIGREHDLEKLNLEALRIAREVANETGTLMAGNLCNSNIYKPQPEAEAIVYSIFKEQIEWAVKGGADFIVGETFVTYGEAALCLKAIKEFGKGLPSVITLCVPAEGGMADGLSVSEACQKLEQAGADVVGLNCSRGPVTMLPLLKEVRKVCKGHIAALPAMFRTSEEHPSFYKICDIDNPNIPAFPDNLQPWLCSRKHVEAFTREVWSMGIHYVGICCGNNAGFTRTMAETIGRRPPASRFSPDMSEHYTRLKDDKYSFTKESLNQTRTK